MQYRLVLMPQAQRLEIKSFRSPLLPCLVPLLAHILAAVDLCYQRLHCGLPIVALMPQLVASQLQRDEIVVARGNDAREHAGELT